MPERVVFLDETAVKTNLTRLRGWAPCGERLAMDAPFGSWGTQTLIAGLTPDAFIAPWVIKGAMDGPVFAAYGRHKQIIGFKAHSPLHSLPVIESGHALADTIDIPLP